jgi:hypothetical protein
MNREAFVPGEPGSDTAPSVDGLGMMNCGITDAQGASEDSVQSRDGTGPPAETVDQKYHRLMQTIPRRNFNLQATVLDGETVLLDLRTGRHYVLDRFGTALWETCTGDRTLQAIHAHVSTLMSAPKEQIADDFFVFVAHLAHDGFITLESR